MKIEAWHIVVILAAGLMAAAIAYYVGNQEGIAVGAATAAATGAEYWRKRRRDSEVVDAAIASTSEAVDKIDEIAQDASTEAEYNTNEVDSMSGSDKADLINNLTDA